MSTRDVILKQALELTPEDRAYVADGIEQSLTPDGAASGEELLAELKRRSAAFRAGTINARPAADVIADLKQRQMGGTSK